VKILRGSGFGKDITCLGMGKERSLGKMGIRKGLKGSMETHLVLAIMRTPLVM